MKILICRGGKLGDSLVTVPSLHALKTAFPGASFDLLTGSLGPTSPERVFEGVIKFSKIYRMQEGGRLSSIRLWNNLRNERYDALAYLAPRKRNAFRVFRDKVYFRSLGIRSFWGFSLMGVPNIKKKPLPKLNTEAVNLLLRLEAEGIGIDVMNPRFDLNISSSENSDLDMKLGMDFHSVFAVGLFSARSSNCWPRERYLELFLNLNKRYDLTPAIFGGPQDSELAVQFIKELGFGTNLCHLGIRETAAAMAQCMFYVGNDTGTMHLAVAAGLPCVVIFSARDFPGAWEPYGEGHEILRTPVECEGCGLHVCDKHDLKCLKMISVNDVRSACDRIIGRRLDDH